MGLLSQRVIYSLLFYILLLVLIAVSKPKMVFDDEGNIRPFGVGDEKTIFSFGVIVITLSVLSFYVFCIIDVIFASKKPYVSATVLQ